MARSTIACGRTRRRSTGFVQAEPFEGQPGSETHRGAHSLRRRGDLRRRRLLRPRSVAHRHDRHAARRRAGRDGLVPDDLRHVPRPAERVRLRHQRRGRSVRRAGARPGRSRRRAGMAAGTSGRSTTDDRVDRRVPHSAAHAALRAGARRRGASTSSATSSAPASGPTGRRCRAIYNLGRLSSAGELRGLNLQTPRNFKLLPYVVSSANRNFTPGAEDRSRRRLRLRREVRRHAQPEPGR